MPFTATVDSDVAAALTRWENEGGEAALPFQRRAWLLPWLATMGRRPDLEPFALSLHDAAGALALGLPLVRERRGLTRIGFADGGLADYNAPILGPAAPADAAGSLALWRRLVRALPKADVLRFERMPPDLAGRPNPLALVPVRPSPTCGLAVEVAEGVDAWRASRPRRYRMELGRCGRLFDALPGAAFEEVASADAPEALGALEHLQRGRADLLTSPYRLDDPAARAFHHALAADVGTLFILRAEDRIVAALFGLRAETSFVMLRVAADPDYSRVSPARLLIVRAMERLAAAGVTRVDLGLGDYDYKRRLGGEEVALVDLVVARSWRGLPEVGLDRARAALRATPAAHRAALRLRTLLSRSA